MPSKSKTRMMKRMKRQSQKLSKERPQKNLILRMQSDRKKIIHEFLLLLIAAFSMSHFTRDDFYFNDYQEGVFGFAIDQRIDVSSIKMVDLVLDLKELIKSFVSQGFKFNDEFVPLKERAEFLDISGSGFGECARAPNATSIFLEHEKYQKRKFKITIFHAALDALLLGCENYEYIGARNVKNAAKVLIELSGMQAEYNHWCSLTELLMAEFSPKLHKYNAGLWKCLVQLKK